MWILIDWNTMPTPTMAGMYETLTQCEAAIGWLIALTDELAGPACHYINIPQ